MKVIAIRVLLAAQDMANHEVRGFGAVGDLFDFDAGEGQFLGELFGRDVIDFDELIQPMHGYFHTLSPYFSEKLLRKRTSFW
jgi:hypothetical protein